MAINKDLTPDIHKYMDILQTNIQRMSQLSMMCKAWCISLLTAGILFFLQKDQAYQLPTLFIPVVLFWFIDSIYLSIERDFIRLFSELKEKLTSCEYEISITDLYCFNLKRGFKRYVDALKAGLTSFSTIVFYGAISCFIVWMTWQNQIWNALF